jgi:predicted 3-demethylubiquinone-9 3-methyltransferase (glyoxalase superfamily)
MILFIKNTVMAGMQKISPNLWFDDEAEQAVDFYLSIFKNSSRGKIGYYNKEGKEIHGKPAGSILTIEFIIEGQHFLALNGGPDFTFSEAISFVVSCSTQEEINYYWEKLSEGGDKAAQQCGWLKDRFGVSWQISAVILEDMFLDANAERSERAMKAMLGMKKLIIADLQKAYNGE